MNFGTNGGFTPLMQAACRDEPLLKALLDAAADANQEDKQFTQLFWEQP